MGFYPTTTYPPYRPAQPAYPRQQPVQPGAPVSKTPAVSLNAAAGPPADTPPETKPDKSSDKSKPLPPGMTVVQTGGDGDEKAVPIMDLLVDPITRKKFDIDTPFTDRLLNPTPMQRLKMPFEHVFVTLPKTVYQGLRGDNRFTFADSLDVANIPYYMGGLMLAASFHAGKDMFNATRQGIGVGLYYLGIIAANQGINQFYKLKTGVDLGLKYRKPNGDIEPVLASTNFPRTDLLTDKTCEKIERKTGIPSNVADPKREVNDQIRQIISAARADKLILGNLFAAVFAGYVARNAEWGRLLPANSPLKAIWNKNDKQEGSLYERLKNTKTFFWGKVEKPITELFWGKPAEANPWLRRSVLGGVALGTGAVLWHSWNTVTRKDRPYQSPFLSNLSQELAPEMSPQTAAIQANLPGGQIQRINRQSIFETVKSVEARTQQAAAANSQAQSQGQPTQNQPQGQAQTMPQKTEAPS